MAFLHIAFQFKAAGSPVAVLRQPHPPDVIPGEMYSVDKVKGSGYGCIKYGIQAAENIQRFRICQVSMCIFCSDTDVIIQPVP